MNVNNVYVILDTQYVTVLSHINKSMSGDIMQCEVRDRAVSSQAVETVDSSSK